MPYQWRNCFQENGKKARDEPFDELSSFFDFYHSSDTNISKADDKGSTNHRNNNMKQQPYKAHLQNDDPCPLHNGLHKWIDCYDNKRCPKFHPFTRPSQHSDHYYHIECFPTSSNNPQGTKDTADNNPYDDDEY